MKKVGDEAKIGAITEPMDFTVTRPSQMHTGPWICMPNTIDSGSFMGHCEIYNVKESGFGVTAIGIERFQQIGYVGSSCLQTGWLNVEYLVQIGPCMKVAIMMNHLWSGHMINLLRILWALMSMGQQNQNCSGGKQVGDFISCGIFEHFNFFVFPFSFYNI